MKMHIRKRKGFTLLEMLLVMVIMSAILLLIINYSSQRMDQFRRDKTALQMQEILAAAMSYYLNNGEWPAPVGGGVLASTSLSQTNLIPDYLPSNMSKDSYGLDFSVWSTANQLFFVAAPTYSDADALIIGGMLPGGTSLGGVAMAQVAVPGQNLNNARSINFGSMYHTGACVPQPTCPSGMTPEIFAVPASVTGVNDSPTSNGIVAYPVTSFTAYATQASATPDACNSSSSGSSSSSAGPPCVANPASSSGIYYRVCLAVTTEKGLVTLPSNASSSASSGSSSSSTNTTWAESLGAIFVTTRCAPPGEPSGSAISDWSN